MSFTLYLTENGVYIKQLYEGEPLAPLQAVMFHDDCYYLPRHWEDTVGDIMIARKWVVPTERGHHTLIEYLPREKGGWPWRRV